MDRRLPKLLVTLLVVCLEARLRLRDHNLLAVPKGVWPPPQLVRILLLNCWKDMQAQVVAGAHGLNEGCGE